MQSNSKKKERAASRGYQLIAIEEKSKLGIPLE